MPRVLIVLRRPPQEAVLFELNRFCRALTAAGFDLSAVVLLGPGAALCRADAQGVQRDSLLAFARERALKLYCCGRSAARHGVDLNALQPPFEPGGYFLLLSLLQDTDRLVEF